MTMEKNFNAKTAEAEILAEWEQKKCFAAGVNAKKGADSFSIMIPPPNVTGPLHMGHAFNTTLPVPYTHPTLPTNLRLLFYLADTSP